MYGRLYVGGIGNFFGRRSYRRFYRCKRSYTRLYWEGHIKVTKNIKSYEGRTCTKLVLCTVANDVLTVVLKKIIIFRETVRNGHMYGR